MLRLVKSYRAYEPETVAMMTEAFDRTCRLVPNAASGEVRRKVALLIIRHVDRGERDAARLSSWLLKKSAGAGPRGLAAGRGED